MSSTCRELRDRLIAHAGDAAAFDSDLARHVDQCASCSAIARRVAQQATALRALERNTAPLALDGRVVAACHGGHRQERTLAAVRALTRWHVPAELDAKVLDEEYGRILRETSTAPAVLDRLVDEDLRDPPRARARRFAGRLERLRAPRALRLRVEQTADARRVAVRRRVRVAAAATLVLALFVSVSAAIYWLRKPKYDFEVVHETSIEGLDPMPRAMLASLTGGMLDAHRASAKKD
jgi:hypothetical protein